MGDKIFNIAEIKAAFDTAQFAGEDGLLVHVRRNTTELFPVEGGMGVMVGDEIMKDELVVVPLGDYRPLIQSFEGYDKPRIGGIYDLKKSFDAARVSINVLPVEVQEKLNDLAIGYDSDRSYSLWDQLRERWGFKRKPQIPTFEAE